MPTNLNAWSPCGRRPHALHFGGPLHEMHWSIISDWTKNPSFILFLIIKLKRLKKKNAENQQLTPSHHGCVEHPIRWVYCKLLSHSLVNAHLGCLQTWAILRKAIISKRKNCREAGEGSVEAHDKNHCWHVGQEEVDPAWEISHPCSEMP